MNPYAKTTHDGKTVDWLTKVALLAAEAILDYQLDVTQGSYSAGKVPQSAGTHDGGGAVDLKPYDADRKVRVLRRLGFAAWHRQRLVRDGKEIWPEHVHAVQVGNERLAPAAQDQVRDYIAGRNGLADRGPDVNAPRLWVKTASLTTARFITGLETAK